MVILIKILLISGLVGLNAFFVASEYALLSVRKTRLEELVRAGNANAKLVLALQADLGLLFSGIQLGVTLASLLMGWLGESIMAAAISGLLEGFLSQFAVEAVAHSISIAIAFFVITALLMVLGELVPKALAYERADQTSLAVARPLNLFLGICRYPVRLLDFVAGGILRVLGQPRLKGHGPLHTAEEVKMIVSAIRRRGLLDEEQEDMIHSVFDLHKVRVRGIMVPWPKVTCFPLAQDLPVLLDRIVRDQHSRIPIYQDHPDNIVGILYTKDLHEVIVERARKGIPLSVPFNLRSILHQPMIVPESMSLNQMLDESRRRHSQMALVVDEFGTFVGLVTIEDVLEQIVGEIQDEYDQEEAAIRKLGENVLIVDASVNIRDLAQNHDIILPTEAGYDTLAGFILERLGAVPSGGEVLVFENRRYTVLEMDGRRVAKVKIEKIAPPSTQAGEAATPFRTARS
jgi:magnesium and cobalt exporter, CNNM family